MEMSKYRIEISGRVDAMLLSHIEFLARVSVPAAKAFRNAYAEIIHEIEVNPFQVSIETDPNLPDGLYRKALFAKRYKALFIVEDNIVFLDAVVDCRQDTGRIMRS